MENATEGAWVWRLVRLDPFPVGIHGWVWGIFLAIVVLLLGLQSAFQGKDPWAGWREGAELRQPKYAEAVHIDAIFRTRANTWSNMAYVAVGLYAIMLGVYDARRRARSSSGYLVYTPAMSILFGAACCYLGFGSGVFHASLSYRGQQLDVAAMYSPLVALIALNIGRWWPEICVGGKDRSTWPVLCALAVAASALLYIYKWSMSSDVVLPGLILTVLVFGVLDRFRQRTQLAARWLLAAGIMLVLAVASRQLDVAGRFFPTGDAWMQGHSFWHLLTSLALICMYFYYRSETD
jgi:predicted membrane channel-forming protein YqfA (hemolysin III family)